MKIYISLLVCSESLIAACFIGLFMACLKLPSRTNIFQPPAPHWSENSLGFALSSRCETALLYHHPVILIIIML
jgi:hypothetical protein